MNKKLNVLALVPIFGTVAILLWLYIKMSKGEINKKNFHSYFISSALIGFLSILIVVLLLNFITSLIDISEFIDSYGLILSFVFGGYLLNLYTFSLLNLKWENLVHPI